LVREATNVQGVRGRFGDRLCFEGGVSVQTTLPFGTAEDVRREVEELIAMLGAGSGYILGPSHAIQAGTPPENVVAMFDTAVTAHLHRQGNADKARVDRNS